MTSLLIESLTGIIDISDKDHKEAYLDYLEEKYSCY